MATAVQTSLKAETGWHLHRKGCEAVVVALLQALHAGPERRLFNLSEGREPEHTLTPLTFTLMDNFPRLMAELIKDAGGEVPRA